MNHNCAAFQLLREELERPGSISDFEWPQLLSDCQNLLKSSGFDFIANEMSSLLRPLFMQYIYAEDAYYVEASYRKKVFIRKMFLSGESILVWLNDELDILRMTEQWARRGAGAEFRQLLLSLTKVGYRHFPADTLAQVNEYLLAMEVEGARRGGVDVGAFYCMLHGFLVIMSSGETAARKEELLETFFRRWNFLRFVYSIMFRCIVGCKFQNFISVANHVANDADYEPYLHLFHAPLKERFEELCRKGTKGDKLEASIMKLEQKIETTTASDELDALCELLFSDDFRHMLDKNRHPSYRELKNELDRTRREMESTVEKLNREIQDMAEKLSAALKASVPLSDIENELMKFQSREALSIYMHLNMLLAGNALWQANALRIRDRILEKQQQELHLSMNITAQSGANVNGIVQQQANYGMTPNRQLIS